MSVPCVCVGGCHRRRRTYQLALQRVGHVALDLVLVRARDDDPFPRPLRPTRVRAFGRGGGPGGLAPLEEVVDDVFLGLGQAFVPSRRLLLGTN